MASLKERIKAFVLKDKKEDKGLIEESFSLSKTFEQFLSRLKEKGLLTDDRYCSFISLEFGIPYFDLSRLKFNKSNAEIIPQGLAYKYKVFPVSKIKSIITLSSADPLDIIVLDDLRVKLSSDIDFVVSPRQQIMQALDKLYKFGESFSVLQDEDEEDIQEGDLVQDDFVSGYDVVSESRKPPIVRVVDLMITEGLTRRASDIHIEPEEDRLKVRYRIDGVLHEAFVLPKKNQKAVIARLKIMSGLNITEFRIPQDGRFKVRLEEKEVDFRVSSLPTKYGEKFVLRALDKANLSIGLEKLGFSETPRKLFAKALESPFGIVLVTGPTGSGKSTTLYSVINHLNTPERNIITIEDPVEYQIEGITQIQVKSDIGLTFAGSLRAVLRQSPDIIMVGEIRDSETADIAIKASLTGELLFSTLHTNDSIGAITRLIDMGIEPFLLASSLVVTSAQRLCRRICQKCKIPYKVPKKVLENLGIQDKKKEFYAGKGCDLCRNTGYLGREAVLEVLLIDDIIKEMITKRSGEKEIAEYARKNLEFQTLREDVLAKFLRGVTTLEEVFRVT